MICVGKVYIAIKKERMREMVCDRFVLQSLRDEVINAHDKKRLILFFPI